MLGAHASRQRVSPTVRPALLFETVGERVRCLTCERRCLLSRGALGWCRTRRNDDGTLVTLTYGAVSSLSANPIEKKPLYHFYPGTVALTVGSWGCNLDCPWCQNWEISKEVPPELPEYLSPEAFVALARRHCCAGTSISFNEPTLSLEWSLEVFRLARAEGLYNTFVTNGYMTEPALEALIRAGLHAANVDLKGDAAAVQRYCGADVEVVWRNCRRMREAGVWLEITTLVIPTVNDDPGTLRGIARRIAHELGETVPWHLTAYYPAYRFRAAPTPLPTLERGWQIAHEEGLRFVYLGNVPEHPAAHTACPGCGAPLILRRGLAVLQNRLRRGRCPDCGEPIPGVWGEGN
ncbi:MAG: AmmeMemoRadiSam system radical SAM enzyme [Chloroflexia bacterium]